MCGDMSAEGLWPRCTSRVDNVGLEPGTEKWEVEQGGRIMLNYAALLDDTQLITHSLISACGRVARMLCLECSPLLCRTTRLVMCAYIYSILKTTNSAA